MIGWFQFYSMFQKKIESHKNSFVKYFPSFNKTMRIIISLSESNEFWLEKYCEIQLASRPFLFFLR